jgi:hypothetical protein
MLSNRKKCNLKKNYSALKEIVRLINNDIFIYFFI